MITQHEDHVCKEGKQKLPTFMDLLKHISNNHAKNPSKEDELKGILDKEIQDEQVEEKEVLDTEDLELVHV